MVTHIWGIYVVLHREQGRLLTEGTDLGTGTAFSLVYVFEISRKNNGVLDAYHGGNFGDVHFGTDPHASHANPQNFFPASLIRWPNIHNPVQPSWSHECGVLSYHELWGLEG